MFTDMRQALEAEGLALTPLSSSQNTAASQVVARHAADKDDLAGLLGALGLPRAEDDLVRLLPHLTTPDDTPTGETMNAYTATAASMLKDGASPEHVRSTLGLSENELAEAAQHAAPGTNDHTSTSAADAVDAAAADGMEALLSWAEHHTAAGIRNRAARVRSDLKELTARRATDAAQREAEERVAKAKAELEAAQIKLREVKTGGRTAQDRENAPVPAAGRRSKEQLAAIRTWARAHGHQVADRGAPARAVLDAYDAAHRPTAGAEAS